MKKSSWRPEPWIKWKRIHGRMMPVKMYPTMNARGSAIWVEKKPPVKPPNRSERRLALRREAAPNVVLRRKTEAETLVSTPNALNKGDPVLSGQ